MEPNNQNLQEIDLSYLSKKTANFFDRLGYLIFKFFRFLLKNIVVLAILLPIGAVAGYFWDKSKGHTYKHEIIVIPNFNSNSYLYNKVENLDLKKSKISSVKIEPVLDVYQFITERYGNLEIAKYLSENNIQFDKYKPDSDVEKMFRYHKMSIVTKKYDSAGKIVDSLIEEFNKDPYYLERQKIEQLNLQRLITELDSSVVDVRRILDKVGSQKTPSGELNIETYSELNNLVNSKRGIVDEINKFKIYQLEQSKVIYVSSKLLNIKEKSFPKFISLPVFLFILFLLYAALSSLFKKYKRGEVRYSKK